MKKMIMMAMGMVLMALGLAGCGDTINQMPATQTEAEVVKKSMITFVDTKTQEWRFTSDKEGSLKNIRSGGISVGLNDVDYVALSSWRFGDAKASPFRTALNSDLVAKFSGLPNNENYTECWVVTKSGKAFRVEAADFDVIYAPGVYAYISNDSSIEWGELDDPSAQDGMFVSLDKNTMTASIKVQFGCDVLFGLKQNVAFQPGMKVIFRQGNAEGTIYAGTITANALGNLSAEITGIPVVQGPYDFSYNGEPVRHATTGNMYVLLPDGTEVPFSFQYNTSSIGDSAYVWSLQTTENSVNMSFWVTSYDPEKPWLIFNYNVY